MNLFFFRLEWENSFNVDSMFVKMRSIVLIWLKVLMRELVIKEELFRIPKTLFDNVLRFKNYSR